MELLPRIAAVVTLTAAGTGAAVYVKYGGAQRRNKEEISPAEFAALFKEGNVDALRQRDCGKLATRLVVRTDDDFAAQLASLSDTALNSKQVVFVTPADSWLGWLAIESKKPQGRRAASALDFVGWDGNGIQWAADTAKRGKLYVWTQADDGFDVGDAVKTGTASSSSAATWEHVFDRVLPFCAATSDTFRFPTGCTKPAAWWSMNAKANATFVAIARKLRAEIAAIEYVADKTVSVDDVLEADEQERPLKARQCLRNLFYLESLFKGDGFTRNSKGERKAPEMIVRTRRLAELPGLEVIDLGPIVILDGALP